MYKRELDLAIDLSRKAGNEILRIYNTEFDVEYKADGSPLTLADKNANDIIKEGLLREFPEYSFLSEETVDDLSRMENEYCWIVDPLDGTKEFANRSGEYTVNIALSKNGRSILGVVYAPVSNELYYASIGSGAYLDKDSIKRIFVSKKSTNLIITASKSHRSVKLEELIERNRELFTYVKHVGSSLKGCLVASGDVDVYYRFGNTSEWDTAAMQIIVEEAGGIVEQLNGEALLYNKENTLNDKGFYMVNKTENIRLLEEDK